MKTRPAFEDIESTIEEYLSTADEYELAFYGGTFTGLPKDVQDTYLKVVGRWLGKGISGIRVSTRPDEIDEDEAEYLKSKGVKVVEIGAQSMFDEVLEASRRGHGSSEVYRAVEILKKHGFEVGIHLMVGLPRSDKERDLESARIVSELNVNTARIHPTLVFRGTELEKMMIRGDYEPLSLEEALDRTGEMTIILEASGIRVIRLGLHVPVGLVGNIVAGPYHPSFGELVRNTIILRLVDRLRISRLEYDQRHAGWVMGHGNFERLIEKGVQVIKGKILKFDDLDYFKALRRYLECSG